MSVLFLEDKEIFGDSFGISARWLMRWTAVTGSCDLDHVISGVTTSGSDAATDPLVLTELARSRFRSQTAAVRYPEVLVLCRW
ncbi:hypothetical protein RRG08_060013 [Elysia crispata]|uniref:Uncharacterized protein n=1 Tax=Elysia crispata TaxID=231223 RepID=A0AAE1CX69_9GAST|nr:hypothetical protein RRG08_060013 [Elysia crispata]